MAKGNVTQKGQVVIPKKLRDKYGIRPNGRVVITEIDHHLAVLPLEDDPIAEGRGLIRFSHSVRALMRQVRREEVQREKERPLPRAGGRRGNRRSA